ncbi:hypothetical protein PG994_014002 [Apiospora phragmitis]|uniref:DUF7025 domain-containing protein n=1 Tax=Apiospora phragmitis TaxID=2905665 RepID=A0ABR1T307_9PEZI
MMSPPHEGAKGKRKPPPPPPKKPHMAVSARTNGLHSPSSQASSASPELARNLQGDLKSNPGKCERGDLGQVKIAGKMVVGTQTDGNPDLPDDNDQASDAHTENDNKTDETDTRELTGIGRRVKGKDGKFEVIDEAEWNPRPSSGPDGFPIILDKLRDKDRVTITSLLLMKAFDMALSKAGDPYITKYDYSISIRKPFVPLYFKYDEIVSCATAELERSPDAFESKDLTKMQLWFIVDLWFVDWDASFQEFKRQKETKKITSFNGSRRVANLEFYPLRYYKQGNQKSIDNLLAELRQRGQLWKTLASDNPVSMYHSGPAIEFRNSTSAMEMGSEKIENRNVC